MQGLLPTAWPDLPAPVPNDVSPWRLRASEFLFSENIPLSQGYKHSCHQCLKGGWPETPSQTEAAAFFPDVPPSPLPRAREVFSCRNIYSSPQSLSSPPGLLESWRSSPKGQCLPKEASISGEISGNEASQWGPSCCPHCIRHRLSGLLISEHGQSSC